MGAGILRCRPTFKATAPVGETGTVRTQSEFCRRTVRTTRCPSKQEERDRSHRVQCGLAEAGKLNWLYSRIVGRCPAMPMSELGQTQKSECATGKSALPSTTGIVSQTCQVRKVPTTDPIWMRFAVTAFATR